MKIALCGTQTGGVAARPRALSANAAQWPQSALAKPGDSFLIVTEGTVTEPVYFDLLLRDLQLSVVRIGVQPGDASDPGRSSTRRQREAKEQARKARKGRARASTNQQGSTMSGLSGHRCGRAEWDIWNDVQQLAKARKVTLAHSTPCFEFWLLLHFGFTTRADWWTATLPKRGQTRLGRDYSTNEETAEEALSPASSRNGRSPLASRRQPSPPSSPRRCNLPFRQTHQRQLDRLVRAHGRIQPPPEHPSDNPQKS